MSHGLLFVDVADALFHRDDEAAARHVVLVERGVDLELDGAEVGLKLAYFHIQVVANGEEFDLWMFRKVHVRKPLHEQGAAVGLHGVHLGVAGECHAADGDDVAHRRNPIQLVAVRNLRQQTFLIVAVLIHAQLLVPYGGLAWRTEKQGAGGLRTEVSERHVRHHLAAKLCQLLHLLVEVGVGDGTGFLLEERLLPGWDEVARRHFQV